MSAVFPAKWRWQWWCQRWFFYLNVQCNVPISSMVQLYICLQVKGFAFHSPCYCTHAVAAVQCGASSKGWSTCLMITVMSLHSQLKCSLDIDVRDVFKSRMLSTWNREPYSRHIHRICGFWTDHSTFSSLYQSKRPVLLAQVWTGACKEESLMTWQLKNI